MKRTLHRLIHRFAKNPLLNLFAGLILLLSGLIECLASLVEGWYDFPIGSHHGIAVFGLLQMVKALPDVVESFKLIEEGEATFGSRLTEPGAPAAAAVR